MPWTARGGESPYLVMGPFQALGLFNVTTAETLWVWHTGLDDLAPQAEGNFGKTFIQQSHFKSEEKMDKYRKGIAVGVVVVVCI